MNPVAPDKVCHGQLEFCRGLSGRRARSAMTEICWTALVSGLLAQCALNRSEVSEDDMAVFATGEGDSLEGSSLSVEAAIRRMRTNLAHTLVLGKPRSFRLLERYRWSCESWYVSHVTSATR